MESFVFSYPTRVYFGSGAAKQALDSELGAYKKVMLAYGVASAKANGIYDEIRGALESLGKEVVDFGGITPNPKYTKMQEGAALARREQVDFILAVGGGSVSDCCKVISAQAVLDEDIWDYEYVRGKFPTDGIPMGVVVTCSGTGSEMNCGAVITHEAKNWKGGIFATTAASPRSTPPIPPPCRACRCSPARLTPSATRWRPISAPRTATTSPTTWPWPSCATPL